MICTTVQNRGLEEILDLLENQVPSIDMAEIRLDRCPLDEEEIAELFSASDTPLVATCRVVGDGSGSWEEAEAKLLTAIESGAAYADLEIEAPREMGKRVRRACTDHGTVMIRSCHFFDGTPSVEELRSVVEKCRRFGGEIVKIAAAAGSEQDADTVLSLYGSGASNGLIAFAMGPFGRMSRINCLAMGAPFTYAALNEDEAAAPGQWAYDRMKAAVFGTRLPLDSGNVLKMPSSKSFAQRAIVAAALADGVSRLGGYSPCGDNEAALNVARTLGAEVTVEGKTVIIKGTGGKPGKGLKSVHVGESGLLTRLTIPVVAAFSSPGTAGVVEVTGEGTLLNRPLKGASEIMARFGTVLRSAAGGPDAKVPLSVQGPLLSGKADVSGKEGSQLISGLLMALPLLSEDSVIHVRDPKSIPYMFITLDVLRKFGIRTGSEMEGDEEFMETRDWACCTGITFHVKGGQEYKAADFDMEGDWSAAANFMVAGALYGKVLLDGLDTTSLQADLSIMDILMDAGASMSQESGEEDDHHGILTVQRAPLRPFDTDLNNCPDLFPIVAVLAAYCGGRSSMQGFKRLSAKESDRGKAILNMLEQFGVHAFAENDTLIVDGETLESRYLSGHTFRGGRYTSNHDHRMAMALTVAAFGTDNLFEIDDLDCIAKSFPAFLETWNQVRQGSVPDPVRDRD